MGLPEMRRITLSIFTYKKHFCRPECWYFRVPPADTSAHGIARCTLFGEYVVWDQRVKHDFGYRRLGKCKEAERRMGR